MNFKALLFLLDLIWTVCGSAICPKDCRQVNRLHEQYFTQVPDLQNSSVAPWNMIMDSVDDRLPQDIENAKCSSCTLPNMIAKPIYLKISVYKSIRNHTNSTWCRCPYHLVVGCTCVREQKE